MPRGKVLSDSKKKEIADFIENNPNITYKEIGKKFDISSSYVSSIAKEYRVQRWGRKGRGLTDEQKQIIIDEKYENPFDSTRTIADRLDFCAKSSVARVLKEYRENLNNEKEKKLLK